MTPQLHRSTPPAPTPPAPTPPAPNEQVANPDDQSAPPEKTRHFELAWTQVVGGALAAMTAAFIGAKVGLAGTIAGAAIASVIAAVASATYTASLKHTQDRVKTVLSPSRGDQRNDAGTADEPAPVVDSPTASGQRPVPWKPVLVGAFAAFALAGVGITAAELVSGEPLSGGQGTTLSQVRQQRTQVAEPNRTSTDSQDSGDDTSATQSPTQSPSDQPTDSTPSGEPTATGAPSNEPSTSEPSPASTEPTAGSSTGAGTSESTTPAQPSGDASTTVPSPSATDSAADDQPTPASKP